MQDTSVKYTTKTGRSAVATDTYIAILDERGEEIYNGPFPEGVDKRTAMGFIINFQPVETVAVPMPGALADIIGDSQLMTGEDDHDPLSKAARLVLEAGVPRHRGRGYTLLIEAPKGVLGVFSEYARTVLETSGEWSPAEKNAALRWLKLVG